MPIPREYDEIISILTTAADEGRVKWRASGSGASVSVLGREFHMWGGTDEETQRSFVSFGFKDPKGNWLDTWSVDEGDDDYQMMSDLCKRARRQAHGIPELLGVIGKALRESKVIGEEETGGKKDSKD